MIISGDLVQKSRRGSNVFQQKAKEDFKKSVLHIHTYYTGRKSPVTIWSHRIALDSRVGDLDVLGLLE